MKTLPAFRNQRRSSAFTLAELLVATAITSLLLLGMTGIFDQSMKAWRFSSRRADAEREVRATLSLIQRDFSGLIVQSNLPIVRLTNASSPLVNFSQTPSLGGSTAVFFLTTSGSAGEAADVAGVGYYLAWATNQEGKTNFNLYRYFLRPSNQILAISNHLRSAGPLFPTSSVADELVGANVVNFRAEFKTLPLLFGNVTSQDGPLITNRPGYVQLELTAYGSEAARTLTDSNSWLTTNSIQRLARTFLWRINL